MDPDLAIHRLVEGATLVFLDVPIGTEFGIDLNTWNVGEKFKGVKMIPPGIHFVFYSAVNKEGQSAPRTGFFHSFKKGEMLVKKWDKYNEDIVETEISDEEMERYQINLLNMDKFLGPYPYESWKKWVSLSNYITDNVLEKLQPLSKKIASATQLILDSEAEASGESSSKRRKNSNLEDDLLPKMIVKPGTEIRFIKIPDRKYPEGSTASEISHHNMDLSYSLQQMLDECQKSEDILGNLQMAFICFLIGHVFEAFEQWQKLVKILCSCDDALKDHPDLFLKFITVMHFQVIEIPRDFFIDIVSRQNFLTTTLSLFFQNLGSNFDINEQLKEKGLRFKKHLTKKFKWDFEVDADEYAPVIVET